MKGETLDEVLTAFREATSASVDAITANLEDIILEKVEAETDQSYSDGMATVIEEMQVFVDDEKFALLERVKAGTVANGLVPAFGAGYESGFKDALAAVKHALESLKEHSEIL